MYDYDRSKTAREQQKKIPESEVASWKQGLAHNKKKGRGPKGIKFGQKIKHQGKDWLVYDFDADAKAPGGVTLVLVSPDYKETLRGAKVPDSYLSKTAAKTSLNDLEKKANRALTQTNLTEEFMKAASWGIASSELGMTLRHSKKFKATLDKLDKIEKDRQKALNDAITELKTLQK